MTSLDPPCVFFNVVVTVESAPRTLVSTPAVVGSLERFPLPANSGGNKRTTWTPTNGGYDGRLRLQTNSTPAHGLDFDKRRLRRMYKRRSRRTTSILGEYRRSYQTTSTPVEFHSGARPRFR
ncbi:hypothetical protein CIHG_04059 [Coccidioides immitis H538.4]|uniref:Uncharacterized protein n=2 Tax=Coccidioides immitis TaxID=5501 RepID=A0A0J8QSG7_COCIT|nr:hypothetical protein CISG_10285 [Coccidioides immitis RMSCC 3703]KMU86271.1 hypothetical protein CIHG_04059 [Coccidioides immitis H538.4]